MIMNDAFQKSSQGLLDLMDIGPEPDSGCATITCSEADFHTMCPVIVSTQ
jgi:hypothetical protein